MVSRYRMSDLEREVATEDRRARPSVLVGSSPAEPEDTGVLATAGDIAAAPFRGLEGAVQDIYGLADTLAFDALPDYTDRFLGESRTRVGGFVEGVSNFAAGFVAAGFVPLGWTAKAGRLAGVAKSAARGAIADFAVFDGHEERLSNLVESFPVLSNFVSEYLAADEGDSEIEGRLKNAVEGMGLGLLTDAMVLSVKALRAGRKARAAGKSAGEVEAAMDKVAPPEQIEAAFHRAGDLVEPAPPPGALEAPSLPEAGAAVQGPPGQTAGDLVSQPQPTPVAAPPVASPQDVLLTMDVDAAKAEALYTEARRRHRGGALLEQHLDPRVNPRSLTEAERFAQGMLETDLNLSRYTGPEGGLQLLRSMEQLMEPLRGLGDASRRSLSEQEDAGLRELADMVGEKNPHKLLVALQRDVQDLPALNRRILAYKTALQAYGEHVNKAAAKALKGTGSDADMVEALDGLKTLAEMELGVKSLLGEQGRGLGANRIPTRYLGDLFDRNAVQEALNGMGGRKRAQDMLEKYRTLWDSTEDPVARAAKAVDLAKGFSGRRALGVLNEYWYNALLGRPTTTVVNALSSTLTTVYKPLELIAGGALSARPEVVADGVRELQALVGSVGESWRAMKAAMTGGGQVLDPKALLSDVHDMTRQAISPENLGVDPDTVGGAAIRWTGRLVNYPSKVLTGTDQFFQQLNYRTVARAQLLKEALANPAIGRENAAAFVEAELDKLVHRGQAYGTAQLYAKGVDDATRRGLRSKIAVDEHAREFVRKAMETPEHARLSALSAVAQRRAQEATFTAPLERGTLAHGYQQLVMQHPLLRIVTPFVRTPVNIIKFASDRSVGAAYGQIQLLAAKRFPAYAKTLESSRNALVRDMLSGDPRRMADARGRFALGMASTAFLLMKSVESAEDGMPLITGRGPSDREQRRLLEESGWQPYSIRIGNKYVSYARLDPFASIIGTAADITNYVRYAADEDQNAVEDAGYGLTIAVLNNFTNKTYLTGLASLFDMLHDPQRGFLPWARKFGASFVPGQFASTVDVQDPVLRDVRSIMDAMRARLPGASDDLPPLRNVLGEPVKRAQSLGSDVSSVLNAFVPILYREVSDDGIRKELAKLQHGFTPPKRTIGALDLTTVKSASGQNAYDRWLELHGEVKLGSRGTLRKAMSRLIESPAYKKVPAKSTDDLKSPRVNMIDNVIGDYRAAAWRQLLKEFPELGEAQRARTQQKANLLRGRETRPSLLQALQPR